MFIFDFEVFKYDWLVVFNDLVTNQFITIVNDREKLLEFYKKNKDKLFIGFNNKRYDDNIFKVILLGQSAYYASKVIIEEDNILKLYKVFDMNRYTLNTLDIAQDGIRGSLKEFEGYLGLSIEESNIAFDIDRALTEKEIEQTIEYCIYDVKATKVLVEYHKGSIKTKLALIKEFNLSKYDTNKTNAQLAAKILNAKKKLFDDELTSFNITKHDIDISDKRITDFYTLNEIDYKDKLKIDIAGVPHVLAYGGLHGALENFEYQGELWLMDVTSYYPSIMIEYDYISRGIGTSDRERFRDIYHKRLEFKAQGDKQRANIYKLILNTVYGCMKSKFNDLYDPKNANNVCISGQLMLIDLIEKLNPYCKLVQSNTDGIVIIPHNHEKIKEVVNDWEKRTRMNMEIETGKAIYQKDVNNYILVSEKGIKGKGGYVYQSKEVDSFANLRQSNAILDDCVVNYFVHKISPEETIAKTNDLLRYQIIAKAGRTYNSVYWVKDNHHVVVNHVNRVYATIDKSCGKLYKTKPNGRVDSIANLPEHCQLSNDNNFDITLLDKEYYLEKAWVRINDFRTGR